MKAESGFTLVEILIVVVILGILAAIVIPQFTDASTQAKESALASDLQMMRSQLELYKIQHNDNLPDTTDQASFEACILEQTDQYGAAGTDFGPYMGKIPSNPFVSGDATDDVTFVSSGTVPSDGTTGWWMRSDTGEFRANDIDPNHAEY
jgi:general secretion pathway protein G